jgi:5'-phosphate synthase pdxT subunit
MRIGVLALQGDIPEHRAAMARVVGAGGVVAVRAPPDLDGLDGILLPGGESTTVAKLLTDTGLFEPLREKLRTGLPVLATCAGLILLAKTIAPGAGGAEPPTLGALGISVRRNDYGRQAESFEGPVESELLRGGPFPGVFIRAPRILAMDPDVEPIARRGDEVVGVRSGLRWGFTFHPELSDDPRLHAAWIEAIGSSGRSQKKISAASTRPTKKRAPKRTASQ